ncbi:MAG: hypothetical protein R3219_07475 [Hydrogenovibrio sp.]|nr:hypothetical protein [Hydrogenovibrio sp.]
MFCLFRNSRIVYPLNLLVLFVSLAPVVYWLYFSLIEKSFVQNFIEGQTLFVDLLLGLPVVLIFAVVIYAMIYWLLKLVIILLAPTMIEKLPPLNEEEALTDELTDEMEAELGEDYWMHPPEASEDSSSKAKKPVDQPEHSDTPSNEPPKS